MAQQVYVLSCLIIGQQRVKEHDLRLRLFSCKGIESVTAAGILRPNAKLKSSLQLFNHLEITKMGSKVTGAAIIQNNTGLTRDIKRFYLASSICETLAKLLREPDDYSQVFNLAAQALNDLSTTVKTCNEIYTYFYSSLLEILGFGQSDDLVAAFIEYLEFKIPFANEYI